jgi:multisubunit Na+/H+ antiporter MnhG subunit
MIVTAAAAIAIAITAPVNRYRICQVSCSRRSDESARAIETRMERLLLPE